MNAVHWNSAGRLAVVWAAVLAAAPGVVRGDAASEAEKDGKIAGLEQRVSLLERRLAALEQSVRERPAAGAPGAPASADALAAPRAQVEAQIVRARQRMAKDQRKYNRDQLAEAEALYQVANQQWRSAEGRDSLKKMVEKYPDINRTGCALLYLGQQSRGEEKVKYLTEAFEKYGDCYYGDGAQVGPLARLLLGIYLKEMGQAEPAQKLFDDILKNHPDAIDHGQRSLAKVVEQAQSTTPRAE